MSAPAADSASPEWEYHRSVISNTALSRGSIDHELSRLGALGWELVVAVPADHHGYAQEVCLIFKRRAGAPDTSGLL